MSLHNSAITPIIGSSGADGSGGGGGGGSGDHWNDAISYSARFDRIASNGTTGGFMQRLSPVVHADETSNCLYAISFWVKFPTIQHSTQENQTIINWSSNSAGGHYGEITWQNAAGSILNTGTIMFLLSDGTSVMYEYKSGTLFRDPTAWYHIYIYVNGTIGTNRAAGIIINGTDTIGSLSGNAYATATIGGGVHQNTLLPMGRQIDTKIGTHMYNGTRTNTFGGYLADFNIIDGQTPSYTYFGEMKNGQWVPKNVTHNNDLTVKLPIAHGTGTQIGVMGYSYNHNAGSGEAFNGTTQSAHTACAGSATSSTSTVWIGKDWGVGQTKKVTGFRIYPSTDRGFAYSSGVSLGNLTFKFYASNSAPTGPEDGTLLLQSLRDNNNHTNDGFNGLEHHISEKDLWGEANYNWQAASENSYRYHWITMSRSLNSGSWYVAELVFYEAGTSIADNPAYFFGDHGLRLTFSNSGTGQDANGLGADTSGHLNHFSLEVT